MAKTDENKYKQPQPNNAPTGTNGYPEKNVKTDGTETRGNGCATKGRKARGPMA